MIRQAGRQTAARLVGLVEWMDGGRMTGSATRRNLAKKPTRFVQAERTSPGSRSAQDYRAFVSQ